MKNQQLPPVNTINVRCPKCNHDDITLMYCEGARPAQLCWPYHHDEHHHRHCTRCHYEWLEAVITPQENRDV
jgi:hypothetical protein